MRRRAQKSVKRTVRYRGALYRLAADPAPAAPAASDTPELDALMQKLISRHPESAPATTAPAAPAAPTDAPAAAPAETPLPQDNKTLDATQMLKTSAKNAALAELNRIGISYNENDIKYSTLESTEAYEGVTVDISAQAGQLSKFNDTRLVLSYRETSLSELRSRGMSIWQALRERVRTAPVGQAAPEYNFSLASLAFRFCNHNYFADAAKNREFYGSFAQAIQTLQRVDEVGPKDPTEIVPERKETGESYDKVKKWFVAHAIGMKRQIDAAIAEAKRKRTKVDDFFARLKWDSPAEIKKVYDNLADVKKISDKQKETAIAFIDDAVKNRDFDNVISAIKKGDADLAGETAVPAESVAIAKQLEYLTNLGAVPGFTKPLKYDFKVLDDGTISGVKIGTDKRTNQTLAEIDAPYKFVYAFKVLGGGKIQFVEARMTACEYDFAVKANPESARTLLTADVVLAQASKLAVNLSLPETVTDDAFVDLVRRSGRPEEEEEKPQPTAEEIFPPEATPPAGGTPAPAAAPTTKPATP